MRVTCDNGILLLLKSQIKPRWFIESICISLLNLKLIPKSNTHERLDFIPPISLSAAVLYWETVVCAHYFE